MHRLVGLGFHCPHMPEDMFSHSKAHLVKKKAPTAIYGHAQDVYGSLVKLWRKIKQKSIKQLPISLFFLNACHILPTF